MSEKEVYDIPKMFRISQENADWLEDVHYRTGQPHVFLINTAMKSARSGERFSVPNKVFYEEKITTKRVTKKQAKLDAGEQKKQAKLDAEKQKKQKKLRNLRHRAKLRELRIAGK